MTQTQDRAAAGELSKVSRGALAGVRVVEAAGGVGAAFCGRLLAGLGAEVVKAEPPGGDPIRMEGPFPGHLADGERGGLHLHLNSGTRSVLVNSLREAAELAAAADVLILAERPKDLASAGLDIAQLRQSRPELVVANVSWFGLTGPYADMAGSELVAVALGGYAMLTGSPEREPLKPYGSLVSCQAGTHAAVGIMAALHARERSGLGQVVDVSVAEAASFLLGGPQHQAHFFGKVVRRNGTRLLGYPPQHAYPSTIRPCADGYLHCHSNNRHVELLAALIPNERLLAPDLLETMTGHADEIDAIMDEWLADKPRREAVRMAQELRLPFTEVFTPGEVLSNEHVRARASMVEIEHPRAGSVLQPGGPMRLSETPWLVGAAPLLGADGPPFAWYSEGVATPKVRAVAPGTRPLDGVRVIDFTNAVAGPIATSMLGDLGAEVIKVEAPSARPRNAAGTAPVREGDEGNSYDRMVIFNELNHSKRGVSLDVTDPRGRALLLDLVRKSDVFLQNFSPRAIENMDLGYDVLRRANPAIVAVSMPAFGLDGPYRDRASYGPGIDAMSGISHLTGYADGPPMKPGNFFCDQQAAALATLGTLTALWHRNRTGEGQHIELAMIEGEMQLLADAYLDYLWNGVERHRDGNGHPRHAPHDTYRCKGEDEWVAIAVETDVQWQKLCRAIGRPELAGAERFASEQARHANREALRPIIEAWTCSRSHYQAQLELQEAGIPAGAALNCMELLEDPHLAARGTFEYVDVPNVGPSPFPRAAYRLSETPARMSAPARFGEANRDVFCGLLGISGQELEALTAAGVTPSEPAGGH